MRGLVPTCCRICCHYIVPVVPPHLIPCILLLDLDGGNVQRDDSAIDPSSRLALLVASGPIQPSTSSLYALPRFLSEAHFSEWSHVLCVPPLR